MLFGTPRNLEKFGNISLSYDNNVIEKVNHFKYLGVVFDSNMTWHDQIDHLSSTIAKRCGIIHRVKFCLPNYVLRMLGEALIMPHFDYCCAVWSNCSKDLLSRMQKLQNRLARILLSADFRTPISDMMDSLHWLKLNDRWSNQLLLIVFKCLKDYAPSYLSSKFVFTHSYHSYQTRHQTSNTLVVPHSNSNAGERTFHIRAALLWNNLPQNIRLSFESLSVSQFKAALTSNV